MYCSMFGKNRIFCKEKGCFRFTQYGHSSLEIRNYNWISCKKHKNANQYDLRNLKILHKSTQQGGTHPTG